MTNLFQKAIFEAFTLAEYGQLVVILPDKSSRIFGRAGDESPCRIEVFDTEFFKEVALKADIGLGESYFNGMWRADDLTSFIRWLLINKDCFSGSAGRIFSLIAKKALLGLERIRHALNRNTRDGSRKNISAHYDLGNEFYEAFLDESMTYSSAFFTDENQSLEEAQFEKYDRLCRKLNLNSKLHLLEIGCGWGGFSIHVARHYGCKVTATTISRRQYEYALERIRKAGLQEKIDLKLVDYRDLDGGFDRIASIEMIEAVGHQYLDAYFSRLSSLLRPDGILAIQGILCPTPLYKGYAHRVDFIRKHIFPGAHLPALGHLIESSSASGNFELMHDESFGLHYAKTLSMWADRFKENWTSIANQGFDESFKLKWLFYLSYCEAGFLERHINVAQLVFCKPDVTSYRYEQEGMSSSWENSPSVQLTAFR